MISLAKVCADRFVSLELGKNRQRIHLDLLNRVTSFSTQFFIAYVAQHAVVQSLYSQVEILSYPNAFYTVNSCIARKFSDE